MLDVFYGMLQSEENVNYPEHFYKHKLRETLVLNEVHDITIWNKPMTKAWTLDINWRGTID